MTTTVYPSNTPFSWIDVVAPTRDELLQLAEKHNLHTTSVQDCLDPMHLPKYESFDSLHFAILRAYDAEAFGEADTIQELTRKTAVFFSDQLLITIHRTDQPYLKQLREKKYEASSDLLFTLLHSVLSSYRSPIDHALSDLEKLEMSVFQVQGAKPFEIKQAYFLKRKAFVFKRMLRLTADLLPKITAQLQFNAQNSQDLRELVESLYLSTEELIESVTSLLNLHISLSSQKTNEASHRTNEVMRVLTIFSVFLLPLNVVTGIYGMNFEYMPELKWSYGYPLAISSMVVILLAIYFWFRKRGWLK